MLKVLIVDDTQEKIAQIRQVLANFVDNPDDLPISGCIRDALKECSKTRYDLVVLDLYIPQKAGDTPDPENAKTFLKIVKEDNDYICPIFVIGITRMKDMGVHKPFFETETLQVLSYAEDDDIWKDQLKNRLEYLVGVKKKLDITYEYNYDVAIINALQAPEHEIMRKTVSDNWEEVNLEDDKTTTYYRTILHDKEGKEISCISCYAPQMASTASATLATKVILRFHPKYLFMTGICAALKGNKVGFGDILVSSHVWDGMSGKYKEEEKKDGTTELVFEPDYRQLSMDADMVNVVNRLKDNSDLFAKIKEGFDGTKPKSELKVHVGPMSSVSAVISSEKKIAEMKVHARKMIGLEMESYGLFYAAEHAHHLKPIYTASIKSASDLADNRKTDKYQPYASYTSAAFVKYIIENELKY